MKPIAVRTAECEETNGSFLAQRDQGNRSNVVRVRAEEELTLRIAGLSATGLTAREQSLERLQVHIVRAHRTNKALWHVVQMLTDQHEDRMKGVEVLTQARFDARDGIRAGGRR